MANKIDIIIQKSPQTRKLHMNSKGLSVTVQLREVEIRELRPKYLVKVTKN